ncbi:MAG: aminopeptidase [Candidatus Hodarchaeota archaeon]
MSTIASEFEKNLDKYAEVIIKVALNLQPGQKLCISSKFTFGVSIELAPLIRLITKKAYQIGARLVEVMWYDEIIHLTRFQHAPNDSFNEFPTWKYDYLCRHIKEGNPILYISAYNPDLLAKQSLEKLLLFKQTYFKRIEPIEKLGEDHPSNNTVVAFSVKGWANKVFPDLPLENRKEKLWDMIFEMSRVKNEDPISAWRDHINHLKVRCNYLNHKQYTALSLKAPGTDLIIGLPRDHIWKSGTLITKSGIEHVPNIPTEEVCTLPHKDKTEGFVTATMPLYDGENLIEDFKLTFSKGKIIKMSAEKGEEFLQNLINMDEGASRLGEIALVPHSSPVSQMNTLFYNTLIDENASCHLAFGRGYRFCIKNGEKMSDKKFATVGGNYSKIHVDFMIGSGEMDVDGIRKDGTTESIMRNGEWTFQI